MLSPLARLLLLCARPTLDAEQRDALRTLVAELDDWSVLLAAAQRNFLVGLLRKHLLESAPTALPASFATELDQRRRIGLMRAMNIVRLQQMLVTEILTPAGVRHVFIKGASLSQQFYGDPYLRQYRDIDLLLDSAALAQVATALQARGFVVSNPAWAQFRSRDLVAFCRFACAVEMRSPCGVLVELHRTLDNTGCVFPTPTMLATATTIAFGDQPLHVLPLDELLIYLCFHHSRHYWSSLHWCADLPALCADPGFDAQRLIDRARQFGMAATVRECLQLRSDLDRLAVGGALPDAQPASRLLPDCLHALQQSIAPVSAGTDAHTDQALAEPDFRQSWQKTFGYRWRFQWSRCHPSSNDYNAWPLPTRWHWLYYPLKPLLVLQRRWQGRRARA